MSYYSESIAEVYSEIETIRLHLSSDRMPFRQAIDGSYRDCADRLRSLVDCVRSERTRNLVRSKGWSFRRFAPKIGTHKPREEKPLYIHEHLERSRTSRNSLWNEWLTEAIRSVVQQVLKVENIGYEKIKFDRNASPTISASLRGGGWGRHRTDYEVVLARSWGRSNAADVAKVFGYKFFPLESRRMPELDQDGVAFNWIRKADRTKTVGFKEPEEGYAGYNEYGDCCFADTPENVLKGINKAAAKRARLRLMENPL